MLITLKNIIIDIYG